MSTAPRETPTAGALEFGPDVEVRMLPVEEYDLLRQVFPFNEIGPPDPSKAACIIAQRKIDGKVVGFFFLSLCVHMEPLWIHEAYRGRPGLLRRLWKLAKQALTVAGHTGAFAIVADRDAPHVLPQAGRLGFQKAPGNLYYLDLSPANQRLHPALKYRLTTDPVPDGQPQHALVKDQ